MVIHQNLYLCTVFCNNFWLQIKEFPEVHYQKNLYQSIYNYTKAMDFIDYFQKTVMCT